MDKISFVLFFFYGLFIWFKVHHGPYLDVGLMMSLSRHLHLIHRRNKSFKPNEGNNKHRVYGT